MESRKYHSFKIDILSQSPFGASRLWCTRSVLHVHNSQSPQSFLKSYVVHILHLHFVVQTCNINPRLRRKHSKEYT